MSKTNRNCDVCEQKPSYCRGMCKNCYDKWLKSVNPEYKQKQLKNTRKWIRNNIEKYRAGQKVYQKKSYTPEKGRNSWLLKEYGITTSTYEAMYSQQSGKCLLCLQSWDQLHVDHSHSTGAIRGLLCPPCNWYLGKVDKDVSILQRIESYVKKPTVVKKELK